MSASTSAEHSGSTKSGGAASASSRSASTSSRRSNWDSFFVMFCAFQVTILVLYGVFVRYGEDVKATGTSNASESSAVSSDRYPLMTDVHVMVFGGFGFLMTYLRFGGFAGVSLTMLIAVVCIEWFILCHGFFKHLFSNSGRTIYLNMGEQLLLADFAAASMLISFGALMGKLTAQQLFVTALVQIFFYSLNERIALFWGVADIGGSMIIHTFGAYFGLACSFFSARKEHKKKMDTNLKTDYRSDLFAMIGTVLLFCYWPSFNSALAPVGASRARAVTNTWLCLAASALAAFAGSSLFRGHRKFFMVELQNATLAGGVAIGAVADVPVQPLGSIAIGTFAGLMSSYGFAKIGAALERSIGLLDTAGVHNLHGMPGILSGVISAIMAGISDKHKLFGDSTEGLYLIYPQRAPSEDGRSAQRQAGIQFSFLLVTLGISLVSGALTGLFMRLPIFEQAPHFYADDFLFEVPLVEQPFHFDRRSQEEQIRRVVEQVLDRSAAKAGSKANTAPGGKAAKAGAPGAKKAARKSAARKRDSSATGSTGTA